ncbi:hypothetical protein PUR71_36120 [Streptomyces sp. SP17BM10]|uniref:hypothetical protein n=1 Tax=Streptomyces sp. SP17BM10 TaxID=3002530 RepID=UPI002E75A2A0|nr:hypothetical protein [Streptomyces sp. SP17BM10]MEE1788285.1 hypothetical protein [Streptomyces sp. SP17BM10]
MPSRIHVGRSGVRRGAGPAAFAGFVLTLGLALTGCDPSAADAGAKDSAPTATAAAPAAATPTPTTTPAAPAPPVAEPTTAAAQPPAPPTTHASAPATPASASKPPTTKAPQPQPQPKVTTAQPPTDPQPQQPAAAAGSGCEIRSNAGNCYEAGQFCRTADLGLSTHDANGRMITCRMVSGKPHWQA